MNRILKKQEEERKRLEPLIRKADERERKIQEEQRKIDEDAKKRNIEIERLNGKINDNLSSSGLMIKAGVATTVSTYSLAGFLYGVVGMESIGIAEYVLAGFAFGGVGLAALSTIPLIAAGGYALKRLAT